MQHEQVQISKWLAPNILHIAGANPSQKPYYIPKKSVQFSHPLSLYEPNLVTSFFKEASD